MIAFWVLLVAAVVSNASGSRIVGGSATTITEYPGIVQVEFRNGILWSQSCAANILNQRFLLSAAHCFEGLLFSISSRRIRAGTTNRSQGGITISLTRRVNHPSYNSRVNMDADISVLQLSSNLVYSDSIRPISIVPQGYELSDNAPVIHAGWGATSPGGLGSAVLRHVEVYSVDRQLCATRYQELSRPQAVTDNMICAGILDVGGRDACQGDSGGPLYFTKDILVGIVSWGQSCAHARFPGVNTRVASYTDWIVQTAS